jgi:hypothetical protein
VASAATANAYSRTLNRRSPMTASEQRKLRTLPKTRIGAAIEHSIDCDTYLPTK